METDTFLKGVLKYWMMNKNSIFLTATHYHQSLTSVCVYFNEHHFTLRLHGTISQKGIIFIPISSCYLPNFTTKCCDCFMSNLLCFSGVLQLLLNRSAQNKEWVTILRVMEKYGINDKHRGAWSILSAE
jgi:hypothetical protein